MSEKVSSKPRENGLDDETRQALDIIREILQETYLLGNNDSELSDINQLIAQVEAGLFAGRLREAVDQARRIRYSKNKR